MYNPDKWIILSLFPNSDKNFFKVLGTWSGGYLNGDSWRINSGITHIKATEHHYDISGESGSIYRCHKDMYGTTALGASIIERLKSEFGDDVRIVGENELSEIFDKLGVNNE